MTDELQHHGVKGMHWGLRKSRDTYQRKANIAYSKYQLSKTKIENTKLKYIKPSFYVNSALKNKRLNAYNNFQALADATQKLIDMNDPIGNFMSKSGAAIDKGIDWVSKKPQITQTIYKKMVSN